jgi:hypothetical protein
MEASRRAAVGVDVRAKKDPLSRVEIPIQLFWTIDAHADVRNGRERR